MSQLAVKLFAYTLLSAVLCFFLHMGSSMLFTRATTEVIGERLKQSREDGTTLVTELIYETDADNQRVLMQYVYLYQADGSCELIEQGVVENVPDESEITATATTTTAATAATTKSTVVSSMRENIRTESDPQLVRLFNIGIQILMLLLYVGFPYSYMWYMGDHDHNRVQFGRMAEDKQRGLWAGLLASIPAAVAYLLLIFFKLSKLYPLYVQRYRLINVCFWSIFNSVVPTDLRDTAGVSWTACGVMLLCMAVLPFVAWLAYRLGYEQIAVRDLIVYKTTGRHLKRRKRRR